MEKLDHFRHILLFEFNRRAKAMEAAEKLRSVWGQCHQREHGTERFSHFREVLFDISDIPSSGKPSGFDEDRLNTLIHNDTRQCTRELANVMNCDHSTILRRLHSMDKVQKSRVWVPLPLSQNHKNQRVHLCLFIID